VGLARGAALALLAVLSAPLCADDILHRPVGDPARSHGESAVVLDAITDTSTGALPTPAELPGAASPNGRRAALAAFVERAPAR